VVSPPIARGTLVDTNVVLRHLLQDHPHSRRASMFLASLGRDVRAFVPATVLFELVFLLERHYGYPKSAVKELVPSSISQSSNVTGR
jgi:predicted nucleic-acid-binding protein